MNKTRWDDLERLASLLNQAMEIVESIRNDETENFESAPKREVDSRSTAKPNPVIQQYDAGEPTSSGN